MLNDKHFTDYPYGQFDTFMIRMDFDIDNVEHGMEGKNHIYIISAHEGINRFKFRVTSKEPLTDDELFSKISTTYVRERTAKL